MSKQIFLKYGGASEDLILGNFSNFGAVVTPKLMQIIQNELKFSLTIEFHSVSFPQKSNF